MPNFPEPTSYGLTKNLYTTSYDIASKVVEMLGSSNNLKVTELEKKVTMMCPAIGLKARFKYENTY